jgi:hypothetical protein
MARAVEFKKLNEQAPGGAKETCATGASIYRHN